MARISLDNGNSVVDVDTLSTGQVLNACEIAEHQGEDPAYDEVDGQVHTGHKAWLKAYCEAHERVYGQVFTIG